MDKSVEHIELVMFRPHLEDIPQAELPSGFSLRRFRDGDRSNWARIETAVGEFSSVEDAEAGFDREFGAHISEMPRRSLVLEADGAGAIGTTTAWWGGFRGETIGMIHWVAIDPAYQGRGLSKPLLSAAMELLATLHTSAFLGTQTWSWRAIGLYQSYGFQRVIETEEHRRGWAIVDARLARRAGT
jgi:ribosomal protein S18 acetylase RimI-like enzyme